MAVWRDYVIPSLVILLANLLSGPHGTLRWEQVTAIFGWASLVGIFGYLITVSIVPGLDIHGYFLQLAVFSLVTALSRDYEKMLKPIADRLLDKRK